MAQIPDDLPERAQEMRRRAKDILERAQARADSLLEQAREQAAALERAADVFDQLVASPNDTVFETNVQVVQTGSMNAEHRAHLSESRTRNKTRLHEAAQNATPKAYSVNSLAQKVKLTGTFLMMAHRGERSIAESDATKVQNAIGKDEHGNWRFPATVANWPKMRKGE